ncbi:MAG: glycosyltransferase [Betaproteobacteria bacterium]
MSEQIPTPLHRSLFGRIRHPYYILAPDFSHTSAGIRCLHELCHALNEAGEEAYLVVAKTTSPYLRTPLLSKKILRNHFLSGRYPIAVYPEVYSGNPLKTAVVARWLLNKPGHLADDPEFSAEDMLFAYDSWCVPPGMHADLLSLPTTDTRLFNNLDNPHDQNRRGFCFYAHKALAFGEPIRSEHRELTSLCHDIPRSPEEIADIFRRSEALYCYEQSAIIHEALSCGCPVLLVSSNYWPLEQRASEVLLMYFSDDLCDAHGHNFSNRGVTLNTQIGRFAQTSAEFNKSTHLVVDPSSDFNFGINDFTIEAWFYFKEANTQESQTFIGSVFLNWGENAWLFGKHQESQGRVAFRVGNAGSEFVLADPSLPPQEEWVHYAAVRRHAKFSLFRNGQCVASADFNAPINTNGCRLIIGATPGIGAGSDKFCGFINELRITKGLARYTADFSPATTSEPMSTASTEIPLLNNPGIALASDPGALDWAHTTVAYAEFLRGEWSAYAWQKIVCFIDRTQACAKQLEYVEPVHDELSKFAPLSNYWHIPPNQRAKALDDFSAAADRVPLYAHCFRQNDQHSELSTWLNEKIGDYRQAIESTPSRPPTSPLDAKPGKLAAHEDAHLYTRVKELSTENRLSEAYALMTKAIELGSQRWEIFSDLGGHYAEQGRLPEAAMLLERGAALEANSTHCLRKLTAVYAMQEDFGRTLAASALILKKEPDDQEMHLFVRDVLIATTPRLDNLSWLASQNSELDELRQREQKTLELLDEIQSRAVALLGGPSPGQEKPDATLEPQGQAEYHAWIAKRNLSEIDTRYFSEHVRTLWKKQPLFEFVLILRPGQETLLADSIDSLSQQFFNGWRLSIFAQTPSPDPEFKSHISQVRWIEAPENQLCKAINQHIKQSSANWLGFFACGSQFAQQFILVCGDYIATHSDWRLIYADEDVIGAEGLRQTPRFKPDLNPDLLRSTDYIGGFFVAREALIAAGGYPDRPGGERYDITLRVLDACGKSAIGHVPDVLYHVPEAIAQQTSEDMAVRSLQAHFERRQITAEIHPGLHPGVTRRIHYLHVTTPKVSIIIPNRNRLDLLGPCIESLLSRTRYPDWEILIVDNGSDDPSVSAYYQSLEKALAERVRILHAPGEFNFSAMNNLAARQAQGEYLLLLNNATQVLAEDWLEVLMSHAQRPEIGAVGPRLLSPDGRQVHNAGMVLGMGGTAGPVFSEGQSIEHAGYMHRALVDQNYSALSGACLLVRKSLYQSVGGLDEEAFRLSNGDVDLCLKIQQMGHQLVWTPFASLIHHGASSFHSASLEQQQAPRLQHEAHQLALRWLPKLANDPAWNRNLSLTSTQPLTEGELVAPWNPDFRDRPRLLWMPLASPGQAEYRTFAPLRALHEHGLAQCSAICQPQANKDRAPTPIELARLAPDALIMHAPVDDVRFIGLLHYQEINSDVLRIYSLDDLITEIPAGSPVHKKLPSALMNERLRRGLAASDRLIVSTEPLAEAYRGMIEDIRLLPNTLEGNIWGGLQSARRRGKKLRVGWAGAQQHAGDLQFMLEVVKATHSEVDWVFFGMMPNGAQAYIAEYHDFVHRFADYPAKLASLDLDLAMAPLEIHPFNEAKSNLRLLEYGILGWPVICTDIFPYRTDAPPVTRLPNNADQWIAAIRERIVEPDALAREGDALREWVKQRYLLESSLEPWLKALTR